jgi:hypothetical protein
MVLTHLLFKHKMKFIECLALAPVGGAGSQQKLLIMLFPRLVDVILLPNLDAM